MANSMNEMDEALTNILQAAERHPNSRASKLIRCVQEDQTQKNIVLLLIELAENAEYATDFGISLRYYLDLFDRLGVGHEIVLNEAGLLLVNSSKIYARRVDFIQELVERQICTLSSADEEIEKAKNDQQQQITEKPKRSRKRLVDAPSDPYEVELIPRKFRKLNEEKRFAVTRTPTKQKWSVYQNSGDAEQHLHPAVWMHATIQDFENDEEIDSKRNYKLFTYHVEHRYNTLVPDINFRLHFKMKDYIDEEEERVEEVGSEVNDSSRGMQSDWPPLSEEYVRKYLHLENRILEEEMMPQRKRLRIEEERGKDWEKSNNEATSLDSDEVQNINSVSNCSDQIDQSKCSGSGNGNGTMQNDSGLGSSLMDSTNGNDNTLKTNETLDTTTSRDEDSILDVNKENTTLESSIDVALDEVQSLNSTENSDSMEVSKLTDSTAGNISLLESDKSQNESADIENTSSIEKSADQSLPSNGLNGSNDSNVNEDATCNTEADNVESTNDQNIDLATNDPKEGKVHNTKICFDEIRVHLPHLDDEGVYFSDLDEQEYRMLSPTVVATDVLPSIPNKKNITIIVDDEIKALLNIMDDEPETYRIPVERRPATPPIVLNIFKFHERFLKRRVLFKLGPDMDLFLQARSLKRTRGTERPEVRNYRTMKWFRLDDTDMSGIPMSPPSSPDFLGFEDEELSQDGEFHGFTEEEQTSKMDDKNNHRLSRDSGVGVDVPTTPGGSTLDTIVEEPFRQEKENSTEPENLSTEKSNESNCDKESDNPVTTDCTEPRANEETVDPNETTFDAQCSSALESSDNTDENDESPSADRSANSFSINVAELDETLAEMEMSSKTKIQKWHEHLQPILAKSRERHHFDVFELGTEIIDTFNSSSSSSTNNYVTFQDVMENQDQSYVSRYFLSSLLLANQNNIKITVNNKSTEKPSSWSDIQLELLNTKRHTVAIEDNIGMIDVRTNENTKTKSKSKSTSKTQKLGNTSITSTIPTTCSNSSTMNSNMKNCTSTPSHTNKHLILDGEALNVNLSVVKTLKQIEKHPQNNDDYDSGIYSSEELVL